MLSGGKEYTAPDNEAHGENDANSEEYSLDFKLVESSSYLEAYKQYSAGAVFCCVFFRLVSCSIDCFCLVIMTNVE